MSKLIFFSFVVLMVLAVPVYSQGGLAVPCKNNGDCKFLEKLSIKSICSNGICKCYTNSKDIKDCTLEASQLGESKNDEYIGRICNKNLDCYSNNGYCNTTTRRCACNRGYVESKYAKNCLPVAKSIDEYCEDDKQCLATMPNTTCQQHKCICINGFNYYNKNICYKKIDINDNCTANEECSHVPRAICNDNKICSCPNDDTLSFDKKRCISKTLDSQDLCFASEECEASFGDAECFDKSCRCTKNNHYAADIKHCVLTRAIDETCEFDYECHQENASLQCLSNKCTCSDDSTRDGNICIGNDATTTTTTINKSILFSGLLTVILTIIMSY